MKIFEYDDHFRITWEYNKRMVPLYLKCVKNIGYTRPYSVMVDGKRELREEFIRVSKFVSGQSGSMNYWKVPKEYRQQVLKLIVVCKADFVEKEAVRPEMTGDIPPMPELTTPIPLAAHAPGKLRPYQEHGVARGISWNRFINGDEPGLGKTLQAIATVLTLKAFPCICIVPASLKLNWQREWHMWTDKKAIVLDDKNKKGWHRAIETNTVQVVIVNYESIKKFFVEGLPPRDKLKKAKSSDITMSPYINLFKSVIIDELHRCKDDTTQTSKFTLRLAHGKPVRIGLTGTPILNKPKDLYSQLCIIGAHHVFGTKKQFLDRYCEGGSGAANLKELNYKMYSSCFFRRKKSEVAKDLPEKTRQTILCEITTRAEYDRARDQFAEYLDSLGLTADQIAKKLRGQIMVQMQKLKQISARGKLLAVRDYVEEITGAGEKLVLFCNLHEIVDELQKMFPKALQITGRQTSEQKQAAVDQFQKDPNTKLVIVNIKAGGVGITLTASSRTAFVEYPYHPADCIQCEDRVHRIGQKNACTAAYFLGLNTIDERSFEIIRKKMEIVNEVVGDRDAMEGTVVTDFLNSMGVKSGPATVETPPAPIKSNELFSQPQ